MVRVSGVRASPQGSSLEGVNAYYSEEDLAALAAAKSAPPPPGTPLAVLRKSRSSSTFANLEQSSPTQSSPAQSAAPRALIGAGERLTLRPQLRDEFGNASFASEGALHARIVTPDKASFELPLKQFSALGSYELSYDLQTKGHHSVHVELYGEDIGGSPFLFTVQPGQPVASKSRLVLKSPALVNVPCHLELQAVDKFGNALNRGGASVAPRALGTSVSACTSDDNGDGTYTIVFTSSVVGEVRVTVRLDNVEMPALTVQTEEKKERKASVFVADASAVDHELGEHVPDEGWGDGTDEPRPSAPTAAVAAHPVALDDPASGPGPESVTDE
jgi:hypothetical protein